MEEPTGDSTDIGADALASPVAVRRKTGIVRWFMPQRLRIATETTREIEFYYSLIRGYGIVSAMLGSWMLGYLLVRTDRLGPDVILTLLGVICYLSVPMALRFGRSVDTSVIGGAVSSSLFFVLAAQFSGGLAGPITFILLTGLYTSAFLSRVRIFTGSVFSVIGALLLIALTQALGLPRWDGSPSELMNLNLVSLLLAAVAPATVGLITIRRRLYQKDQLVAARERAERAYDDLRHAQHELVEAEKMRSLGQLVAGVAHEINTPIGIAVTAASTLRNETLKLRDQAANGTARKSDVQRYFGLADETTEVLAGNLERAAELVISFKRLAVDQASNERRTIELDDYMREVMLSLGPKLRRTRLMVQLRCSPTNLSMDTYPGILSQIASNLILNSCMHAFDEDQAGQIQLLFSLDKDDNVHFTYSDNGRGMSDAIRARAFEPFFTTRRNEGGSGLGLHIVYNLITTSLGGTVRLESAPGRGARFLIRLPRVSPLLAEVRMPDPSLAAATSSPPAAEAAEGPPGPAAG